MPNDNSSVLTVTVACPADGTAERIGSSAVAQGLAAAAHTWPIRSTYRWQAEVHHANEVMLSMVTTAKAVESLARHVRSEHPYEVADISVQARESSEAVVAWVDTSVHTRSDDGHRTRTCYVTLDVNDLSLAAEFWTRALGGSAADVSAGSEARYAVVNAPSTGIRLLLQKVSEPRTGKNRMHLDLETDDLDAEVARLLEAGASVGQRFRENGFTWVQMADPEGNEFCVLQVRYPELLAAAPVHGQAS